MSKKRRRPWCCSMATVRSMGLARARNRSPPGPATQRGPMRPTSWRRSRTASPRAQRSRATSGTLDLFHISADPPITFVESLAIPFERIVFDKFVTPRRKWVKPVTSMIILCLYPSADSRYDILHSDGSRANCCRFLQHDGLFLIQSVRSVSRLFGESSRRCLRRSSSMQTLRVRR
jgi:hypothetical protein